MEHEHGGKLGAKAEKQVSAKPEDAEHVLLHLIVCNFEQKRVVGERIRNMFRNRSKS